MQELRDGRIKPRVKVPCIFRGVMAMLWARVGSLNALEQIKDSPFLRKWIGADKIGSADTQGAVFCTIDCPQIRDLIRDVHTQLMRNKALRGMFQGMRALIVDGHEQTNSYKKECTGCSKRRIQTEKGEVLQNYHRHVTAMLVTGKRHLLLDFELQRPGEDEVACATRLLERIFKSYARAFDVVLGDGLYAQGKFFKMAQEHGKEVIAVLKDDRRDLMKDAMGIFERSAPQVIQDKKVHRQVWDMENFTSWEGFGKEVRVVRSLETRKIKRQKDNKGKKDKKEEILIADWVWVTTLPKWKANTATIIWLGHERWAIENHGFNELSTYWHANHIYKHDPHAIEAFWLAMLLAYDLFHAFIDLNLKPQIRVGRSIQYWAKLIAAELYAQEGCLPSGP